MAQPAKPSAPLLAIVGPTAGGKTGLSLALADRFGGEIISADSRQIYRGMDIGTAKAGCEERRRISHHLIDIVNPDEVVSLAEFQERAYRAITEIHGRSKLPILVGGTGQWVWGVLEGWQVPRVPPDEGLRAQLEAEAAQSGAEVLHQRLAAIDPLSAARIDYRNVRRVIRALEVCLKTGLPISAQQQKHPPDYQTLCLGLTMPREELYQRIDERVEMMMAAGLLEEVKGLLAAGYSPELPSMSGLGYRQIVAYLQGQGSLEEAVEAVKNETHRFARQQYTWFRPDDERIRWFDPHETQVEEVSRLVEEWLGMAV